MSQKGRSRKRSRRKQNNGGRAKNALLLLCVCVILAAGVYVCVSLLNSQSPAGRQEEAVQPTEVTVAERTREEERNEDDFAAELEAEGGEVQEIIIVADAPDEDSVMEETEPETQAKKYDTADGSRPISQKDPETITIRFAGDILFDPAYAVMASLLQRGGTNGIPDIAHGFDETMLHLMRDADIFMVNNEFPYSKRGEPLPEKQFTFRADPKYAALLNAMGADIVSLANNHVNDYGRNAMLDTFDTIDAAGIARVGAGRNIGEASAAVYFTNGDVKIGFLSATQIERMGNPDTVGATEDSPGVFRCMNSARLLEKIRETREACDFVIVYVHWGTEGTDQTDGWQEKQAVEIADAGADLIIGDHPHVLQRIGLSGRVPVVYSLGNYLFNSKTLDTCLVEAVLDAQTAELKTLKFIPAVQSGCRTKAADGAEKERILQFMRDISRGITIDPEGFVLF